MLISNTNNIKKIKNYPSFDKLLVCAYYSLQQVSIPYDKVTWFMLK